MSITTIIHVLRHGEVYNPEKILYGRLPGYRLSELGTQMAKVVAENLARRDITHVVSSPLERAIQTAEPIANYFNLPIATDDRLLEALNYFEGKQFGVGDGALKHPRVWWVLRNPFRPSWGEAYGKVAERMYTAILSLRDVAEGHEAVCVSHQLPIEILRRHVQRRMLAHDPRRRQCALASLTSFHFSGTEIVDIRYSQPAEQLISMSPTAKSAKGA